MNRAIIRDPRRRSDGTNCHECGHPKRLHYKRRRSGGKGWGCPHQMPNTFASNPVNYELCKCTGTLQKFKGTTTVKWPKNE